MKNKSYFILNSLKVRLNNEFFKENIFPKLFDNINIFNDLYFLYLFSYSTAIFSNSLRDSSKLSLFTSSLILTIVA